uniref:rRNA biogenesis protein RRP36 n=2 Tax=Canis lupus familiaris TaxID=9615 RepID=A0A8P0N4W7_CANLF
MLRWTVHLEGGPRRVNHAAVAVGHRVYSFGGYCSGEDYETLRQIDVHIFNAVSLRWTKLPPVRPAIRGQAPVVPYMRYGHSTVLIDDTVFLWGGRNDTEGACNVLYAFDVNTHKWSTPRVSGTVPGARDGHSACVLGKTMYIFGGYEQLADCFSNDIHKLDTSTMTWTLICTKGNPARWRDFHSATMLGSHMYVFGGRADRFGPFHSNNEIYCNRIRVFDTRTEAWLDCPPTPVLPEGRRSHSAFGYNGELYIFGGYNARLNRHFHDLWKFNPVSFTWKKIEPKGKGPCPRRRQCCCIVGDKIVLFGGTSPSPEEGLGDDFDLIDHSDLHILDFSPSLKTLCKLAVIQYNLDQSCLPHDIRPLEMSAKVRVPFLRQVVPISKKVARDPRFDDLSGEYNPEVFDKTYEFLNDIRAKEKELVKKQLKKHHSGQEHEKLQQLLQRMEQQEMAQQERRRQQELRLALKQEQRARAQQGHRPYFLKKSEQRQLVLAEKFKELKRSKRLESFLSRKRRRNAGKDRRHLPLSKE